MVMVDAASTETADFRANVLMALRSAVEAAEATGDEESAAEFAAAYLDLVAPGKTGEALWTVIATDELELAPIRWAAEIRRDARRS